MTATTYRSPAITEAAKRARDGKAPFPALSHRQSMKALRSIHPAERPTRLRRGAARLSFKFAAGGLLAAVVITAGLIFAYGAALWVVGQIAITWRGA